jgi:hypothetical protein
MDLTGRPKSQRLVQPYRTLIRRIDAEPDALAAVLLAYQLDQRQHRSPAVSPPLEPLVDHHADDPPVIGLRILSIHRESDQFVTGVHRHRAQRSLDIRIRDRVRVRRHEPGLLRRDSQAHDWPRVGMAQRLKRDR